ncbi:MAG: 4Fe-4S binding protein [Bacteroidetes bacterium]|nr:4Fe-4S binding protein [Bacteroidota bacterium]
MAKYIKNIEKPVQKYRFVFQSVFALLCIYIGIEFYLFTTYLESGGTTEFYNRPAGVEGFLPISALMSIYYFFLTGEIHDAHPAGFFILLAIISISLVFGKSFCSWLCPVGFISELVGDFGEKIQKKLFKRKLKLPRFLDIPLRSLKYLLLAFFVYAIFFSMTALSLKYFLDSPYNIVADVKMYHFFANITQFSLIVIGVLFLLSIIIRNFWCRYLCPYGALLGITSLISPNKIKRDPISCIDCGLCAKACPSNIKVNKIINVISDECSTCLSCVDACPVADTLDVKSLITKKKISKPKIAIGIAIIYLIVISIGMFTGNWESKATKEDYLLYYQNLDRIGHPTSVQDIETLNKVSEKEKADGRKQNK